MSYNKNVVIQKSDEDNSFVIVHKSDYLDKTVNPLNDRRKFKKIDLKYVGILNFAVNQEKCVDKILKRLVASNSICEQLRRFLKPIGTRPGTVYEGCKVHKDARQKLPVFSTYFVSNNTPTYKLAKFLVPILRFLTSNEYMVKYSFAFAEEMVEQDSEFFYGNPRC